MSKTRLYEIQLLTGIAIFLVVAGHLASRGVLEIPFYVAFKKMVYKFHMPLFMFLSGFIAFYSYKPKEKISDYFLFVKKKTYRLFPAYILLSFIFIIGKSIVNSTMNLMNSFYYMLFYPSISDSGFLWYIYVLFMFYLILPILVNLRDKLIFLLPFLFIISFLRFPTFMALQSFFWYLPFFVLGGIVCLNYCRYKKIIKRTGLFFLLIFILWMLLELNYVINLPKQVVGVFAIIGLHYFACFILKRQLFFENLGKNSFYIYLFNTMFMGALSTLLIRFLGKEGYYNFFYFFAPFLICVGLYFPILLHKYLISKVPILKDWIK